jgi:hypothetical protein
MNRYKNCVTLRHITLKNPMAAVMYVQKAQPELQLQRPMISSEQLLTGKSRSTKHYLKRLALELYALLLAAVAVAAGQQQHAVSVLQ